jgi:hypothetical protein
LERQDGAWTSREAEMELQQQMMDLPPQRPKSVLALIAMTGVVGAFLFASCLFDIAKAPTSGVRVAATLVGTSSAQTR